MVLEGRTPQAGGKRHAIGFVADASENASLLIGFLTDQLVGRYVLMPHRELIDDYVKKEGRSVWAYELTMTAEERRRDSIVSLRRHRKIFVIQKTNIG